MQEKDIEIDYDTIEKSKSAYDIIQNWRDRGLSDDGLPQFISKKQYKSVAVYGYSDLGKEFLGYLKNLDLHSIYLIDQRAHETKFPITAYTLNDELPVVDCVFIGPIGLFPKLEKEIKQKTQADVYDLTNLLNEINNS